MCLSMWSAYCILLGVVSIENYSYVNDIIIHGIVFTASGF